MRGDLAVKMMIVILDDIDADVALNGLLENDFRVTRVASTGSFLKRGNTTLLLGTEDERVDDAITIIRQSREADSREDRQKATVFVLDLAHFDQL
jgi:uncharacterized protein YaaQ